jgi:hypothetical protein
MLAVAHDGRTDYRAYEVGLGMLITDISPSFYGPEYRSW